MMFILLQASADTIANAIPVVDPGIRNTVDALSHQAGLVAITVWGIQVLKKSKWCTWIHANSAGATQILSTLAALAAALAVQVTGNADAGWNIAIPPAGVMWDGFIRFAGQKMGQDILYAAAYRTPIEVTTKVAEPINAAGKPVETGTHDD